MENSHSPVARWLAVTIAVLGASGLLSTPSLVLGATQESLDSFVRTQMTQRRIPGMAIAVIEGEKVALVRAYGTATLEFDLPVRRSTRFSIASITKSFTAVAVMMLVERRQLTLDDPIGRHLEHLPASWREVTVRQLLNHTSGLPDLSVDSYTTATIAQSRAEAFEVLSKRPMDFAPGSAYRYNQTNYMLLGMLVESKCGKPFEQAVVEQLFAPLGIDGPVFGDARAIVNGRATTYTPYRYGTGRPVQLNHLEVLNAEMPPIVHPGGGLNISIADFAEWLAALLNGKLISRESLETLWAPARLNDGSTFQRPESPSLWQRYGLGWVLGEHDGHEFAGGTGGIRSAFFVYPKDDLAIVVLTNSQGARPESLVQGIGMRYLVSGKTREE
jgi:CubicO group peptidase (beta-lactamase class C family)